MHCQKNNACHYSSFLSINYLFAKYVVLCKDIPYDIDNNILNNMRIDCYNIANNICLIMFVHLPHINIHIQNKLIQILCYTQELVVKFQQMNQIQ